MRGIMRKRDTGEQGNRGEFGRTVRQETEVAVLTPELLNPHDNPDINPVLADIAPVTSPYRPDHRTWHLDRDQAEDYVASIDAPAARRVVDASDTVEHTVTDRGEIEAFVDRGDGQFTSIGSFGKDEIEIGMSGWGESPFESQQIRYDWLEVDTSDPDSTLRARATVTLSDGAEEYVDGFDTGARVQEWSPDGVRRALRDACDDAVLQRLTRQATGDHE